MKHLLLFFGLFYLAACNSPKEDDGFSVAPTRIPYKFHKQTGGPPPSRGDVVIFDWELKDDQGNDIPSPVAEGMPTAHVLNGAGLLTYRADPVLSKVSVGDSLTIRLTTGMLYRNYGVPKGMGSNEWINCHLKITGISGLSAYQKREAAILGELRARRSAKNDSLLRVQAQKTNASFQKMDNGVYYHIKEQGQGKRIQGEDQLRFHYKVYLLNGSLADDSYKRGEPFEVIVGRGEVIEGLDRLFPELKVGTKATALIPSGLAYGERRLGSSIPANSNLRFELSIEGVK